MPTHRAAKLKACDACHQQKTKCYWRYPKCLDCLRLGRDCTFTRPRLASTRAQGDVTEYGLHLSLNHAQADELLTPHDTDPARTDDFALLNVPASDEASELRPGRVDADNDHAVGNLFDDLPDAEELNVALERYFAEHNHTFPIFNQQSFLNDPIDYLSRLGDQTLFKAMLNAIMACTTQRESATLPSNALSSHRESSQYVREALSVIGQLIVEPASIARIQLLLCIIVAIQETQYGDEVAADILAIAIRKAHSLGLHRLDEVTGIGNEDRLENIRLFWCLYILDRDTMMRNHIPPLINDDDVRVLEPKLVSDDRCGLITPIDGHMSVNIFTARQRLAQIESYVWRNLKTFKSTYQPLSQRSASVDILNDSLSEWKAAWLVYGDLGDVSNAWSRDARIEIVGLQFRYFRCIVRANPGTPYNFDTIRTFAEQIESQEIHSGDRSLTLQTRVVAAARETLQLAGSMRQAGFKYLCDALQYVVPAIAILLVDIVSGIDKSSKVADREVANAWLELFGYVVETTQDDDFRSIFRTCRSMMEVASASMGRA